MNPLPEEHDPGLRAELERLFEQAIALPVRERGAFVELKCVHCPMLRERLRRLIEAHEQSEHNE